MKNIFLAIVLILGTSVAFSMPIPLCAPGLPTCPQGPSLPPGNPGGPCPSKNACIPNVVSITWLMDALRSTK